MIILSQCVHALHAFVHVYDVCAYICIFYVCVNLDLCVCGGEEWRGGELGGEYTPFGVNTRHTAFLQRKNTAKTAFLHPSALCSTD